MIMQEITRRLNILNKKKVPVVDATMLRQGGMQGRVHRQEIARYARQIQAQKTKLQSQLTLLETQKDDDFAIMNRMNRPLTTLEKFDEPQLKRIRSRRSFFN